jgi:KTSC domain
MRTKTKQGDPWRGENRQFRMEPVKSGHIAAVGYNAEEQGLFVRFNTGAQWHYRDVPPEVHQAMMAAPSVGGYFHAVIIKGSYARTKTKNAGTRPLSRSARY